MSWNASKSSDRESPAWLPLISRSSAAVMECWFIVPQAAAMREALGIYTTGFGFGLPTDGIHGPNERCALMLLLLVAAMAAHAVLWR